MVGAPAGPGLDHLPRTGGAAIGRRPRPAVPGGRARGSPAAAREPAHQIGAGRVRARAVRRSGSRRGKLDPVDVSGLDAGQRESRARELVEQETGKPFDLASTGGFRHLLLRLGEEEHILVLTSHHLITDGWSLGIMVADLGALYAQHRTGIQAQLPELSVQPADYAAWQRKRVNDGALEDGLDYWAKQLASLAELDFPTDRPRGEQQPRAGELTRPLSGATLAAVDQLAAAHGVRRFVVLLAGFLVVLGRHTGQQDIAIGSVFSGRTRSEIEPLIGFFANTLVLRGDLSGAPTFQELIGRCHRLVTDALAHQDVPFALVVDALGPERTPGRNPLFQVSFSMLPGSWWAPVTPGWRTSRWTTSRCRSPARGSTWPSSWRRGSTGRSDSQRSSRRTCSSRHDRRLVVHLSELLEHAAAEPGVRCSNSACCRRPKRPHCWSSAPPARYRTAPREWCPS